MSKLVRVVFPAFLLAAGLWASAAMYGGSNEPESYLELEAAPDPPVLQAFAVCKAPNGEIITETDSPPPQILRSPPHDATTSQVNCGGSGEMIGGGYNISPPEAKVSVTHNGPDGNGSWIVMANR